MIQDFNLKLKNVTDQLNAVSDMVLKLHDEIRDEYDDLSKYEKLTDHGLDLLSLRDMLLSRYFDVTDTWSRMLAMEERFCEKDI